MKNQPKQHGGRREGSGRKPMHPEGTTERLFANVPKTLVRRMEEYAHANDISRSDAVTEAIRRFVRRM